MAMQPRPRLLIPRPRAQAAAFAEELAALHPGLVDPVIAPVIEIRPLVAEIALAGMGGLIFTSANGVDAFVRLTERRDLPAWCVGGRSAERAQEVGFDVSMVTESIGALVPVLPDGIHFFYPRGRHVSRDLGRELSDRVTDAVVYEQCPVSLPATELDGLAGGDFAGVTLFSPRSAHLLSEQLTGAPLPGTILFCLSTAVAAAAQDLGGEIRIATSPDRLRLIELIAASFTR